MYINSLFLERNRLLFNFIFKKISSKIKLGLYDSQLLDSISTLSYFAWQNHTGYLYNSKIENYLLKIGSGINAKNTKPDSILLAKIEKQLNVFSDPIIFHIATELYDVGGHTRVLIQTIKRMPTGYKQVLIVLNQELDQLPANLLEFEDRDVLIISLNKYKDYCERALMLRLLSEKAAYIFSIHHPNDIVPTLAYSVETNCPVFVHSHAHSWFWVGVSITDVLLSYTDFHKKLNEQKRNCRQHFLLYATQIDDVAKDVSVDDKLNAKRLLGFQSNTITLLSVGTHEKFIPNETYNFFTIAETILHTYSNVEIIVIGIEKEYEHITAALLLHNRIRFLGSIADINPYYKAADIYIEAMPLPSLGATIYSIMEGKTCPLYKYGERGVYSSYNFIESDCYFKYLKQAETQTEYLQQLDFLINNPEKRIEIAESLRVGLLAIYDGDAFTKSIKKLLNETKNLKHRFEIKNNDGEKIDDWDNEIAEGSKLKTLRSVFEFFSTELSMYDKMKLTILCYFKGIHTNESKNFSICIRQEIKKHFPEINYDNPLWNSYKYIVKNTFSRR